MKDIQKVETMSPTDVGTMLRIRPQSVRLGLQQGRFPFGTAIQKPNGRWTYNIIKSKVYEYAGIIEQKNLIKEVKSK